MMRDFRGRITLESWCWIEAEARVREIDAQQVVREVLHAWALQQSPGGSCHALRFGQTYPLTLLGAIQYIALRWVEESQ